MPDHRAQPGLQLHRNIYIYIYIYIYNTLGSGTSGCLNVYKNGKQEKKKKLTFCELKA
jgi:hypothetical protein